MAEINQHSFQMLEEDQAIELHDQLENGKVQDRTKKFTHTVPFTDLVLLERKACTVVITKSPRCDPKVFAGFREEIESMREDIRTQGL